MTSSRAVVTIAEFPERGDGLNCPVCKSATAVKKTVPRRGWLTRRRVCTDPACGHRFSTHELLVNES